MSHIQNPGGSGGGGDDDQTAAEVPFTPAGNIAATDVQSAIVELDNEKAPIGADYLVGTSNAGLSAEIVVGTTPGGELGNTWASPTVDASHSGSTHAATQAAAEATAAAALAAHEADSTSVHGITNTANLVTGPASATDNAIALFNGTTGKIIKDSAVLLSAKQDADATLTALAAYNTNGLVTQTAADTFTGRTITGTADRVGVTNGSGVAGNPTLTITDTAVTPGSYTNTNLTVTQDGRITSASNGSGATVVWEPPVGMRLSAATNVYVTGGTLVASATLYWTTVLSGGTGVVTGYNGAALARKTVQQKSLALTITAAKNYDVFYDYDGDALALSAVWTDDVTRADALADEQGAIVLGSDHTKLWLGTIRASATDLVSDGPTLRFIYNAYNQAQRRLFFEDATGYSYASATVRQLRGQTANQVAVVAGALSSVVELTVGVSASIGADYTLAVGEDSTTAVISHAAAYQSTVSGANYLAVRTHLTRSVPLGYHFYAGLERAPSATSATIAGSDDDHFLGGLGSIVM